MTLFESNFKSILAINLNLLTAAGCGFVAWAVWPNSVEWWGFGVVSIFSVAAGCTAATKAIGLMVTLHTKNRAIADYMAQGARQKSARVVSDRELEEKGLLG